MSTAILTTGGAGYIGSHVVAEILAAGGRVVILDDFSNSRPEAIVRIESLGHGRPDLVVGDVGDSRILDQVFSRFDIASVIHLAGLKSVSESVEQPLRYYRRNVFAAVILFEAMLRHKVFRLVFSSSAAVYGTPDNSPITEDAPLSTLNPYGRTKLIIENMINELVVAEPALAVISLRYFNPVGAQKSGLIGETPRGIPNNLFPYIAQTAAGVRKKLGVFGNDYPTADGTGVRDYIHVLDLAQGHLGALDYLLATEQSRGTNIPVNLGCGRGYSVLEAIAAFSGASNQEIPFVVEGRRPGDASESVADPTRAAELLGWRAKRGIEEMCADHWEFQRRALVL